MPTYEFEDAIKGFSCTVQASGLTAGASASAKKKEKKKIVAASKLLWGLARLLVAADRFVVARL